MLKIQRSSFCIKSISPTCRPRTVLCLLFLMAWCWFQFILFEWNTISLQPCTTNRNLDTHRYHHPHHQPEYDLSPDFYQQHQVVVDYLMDKNRRLSAQIKDLIHNQRMKYSNVPEHKKFKPYKSLEDIQFLLPLPLIDDGLHQGTFSWTPRHFNRYKMCHFLSSSHYHHDQLQEYLDENVILKMNDFIQKQKQIPKEIQSVDQLMAIPSFTISTYNTFNTNPFVVDRMQEIARILSQYHVDIVALQEIRYINYSDDGLRGQKRLQHELILDELKKHSGHHSHGIESIDGEQEEKTWNHVK